MKVCLKASQNGKRPKLIVLTGNAVIGRSDNCNLRIISRTVSRKHCRIRLHKHGVSVTDLGSSNGTLVNNSKLESAKRRQLRDRDQITIGPMSFVLRIMASPETSADDELLSVTQPMQVLRSEDFAETKIDTDNPDLNDLVKESGISDEPELVAEDDFAEHGHDRDVTTTMVEPDMDAIIVESDEPLELAFEDGEDESHAGENLSTRAGSVLEETRVNDAMDAMDDAIGDGEADLSDAGEAEYATDDRFAEPVGPSEDESETVAEVGDDFAASLVVDADDSLDETVANGDLSGSDEFVAETFGEADLFAGLDEDDELDDQHVAYAHEEDDFISAMTNSGDFDDLSFDDPDEHAAIAAIVGSDDGVQTQYEETRYEASDRIEEKESQKKNRLVSLLCLLGKPKKKE